MSLLSDLRWRGLIHQTTDDAGLDGWLEKQPRTLYAGFDPTADSLHVGNLVGLMVLRRFQQAGHKPIAVVGGATGMIGDPSGKSDERNLLSKEDLERNVVGQAEQMRRFLDFDTGSCSAELVNNFDWIGSWSYLEFLRDVGKNFPVNVMLAKDSVKSRLGRGEPASAGGASAGGASAGGASAGGASAGGASAGGASAGGASAGGASAGGVSAGGASAGGASAGGASAGGASPGPESSGMSYTEFSYMLLQAYDFVHLHDTFGCELQAGGSDQWGNITAGIDLARRMRGVQLYGFTWPLLTTSGGAKMGKTESGAVWLSPQRTSPYQFYQYWINVDDADAGGCLRMLTELPRDQIESLDAARLSDPAGRDSQRQLAEELTRLVHGTDGLAVAQRATEIFFGAEISDLDDAQLGQIFADVPSKELPRSRLRGEELSLIDALVESGLARSKGEARRKISQGGVYVNNRRIEDLDATLGSEHLASESVLVLRSGKKKYALLRFT